MEITKLATQARNPDRVNVFVDGQFYVGVAKLVAIKLGLKPGLVLNPRLLDQLNQEQSGHDIWEYALRLLQRGSYSQQRMREKLETKFGPNLVPATIQRLVASGLLDDKTLAQRLAAQYATVGKASRRMIDLKLRTKGIPSAIAKAVLEEVTAQHETESARQLALAKYRQLTGKPWPEQREKISAYLARKGFSYPVIKQVVVANELQPEESR